MATWESNFDWRHSGALGFLRRQDVERPRPSWDDAPLGVVAGSWLRILQRDPGRVDHRAYTLCAVERLREALRRRDVFVEGSRRWADPRRQLLSGAEWEAARDDVCRSLRRSPDARIELGRAGRQAWRRLPTNRRRLVDNDAVTIVGEDGKARLKLSPLDRLDEPASLVELRRAVGALLPKVDLPEVVLEVARWTGFAEEFTHVSEAGSRAEDLVTSICAVLVAEACNVGLEPMVRQDVPALRRGRLGWVDPDFRHRFVGRSQPVTDPGARTPGFRHQFAVARIPTDLLSSGAMRRAARVALSTTLAAVTAVGLSGCGGTRHVTKSVDAAVVDGAAGFSPSTITVDKRNRVTLDVGNTTDKIHGFSIEGYGVQEEVKPGEPIEVQFTATKAGTYKVYCQLHESHQTATLVVR